MEDLPDQFQYLGSYSPPEAKRLLAALENEDIPVHAEFHDGLSDLSGLSLAYGSFGNSSQVIIATPEARRAAVSAIHARLFGSGLPENAAAGEASAEWNAELAEHEFSLLTRREELVGRIADLEKELHGILTEIAAISSDLESASLKPDRRAAMANAKERHLNHGAKIEAEKAALNAEMEKLDLELYGEDPASG